VKKLKVLALMHADYVPPDDHAGRSAQDKHAFKTEYHVCAALRELGHEVTKLGVRDELHQIRVAIEEWKPDIVFNLLEEFRGEAVYDLNVTAFLELLGVAYTGCGPRGLLLARDKSLSKQLLTYHRIRVPRFAVVALGRAVRRPRKLEFPLIVKSLLEDSSLGIAQKSVVRDDDSLAERVRFIHERIATDAIVEEFIPGRELYVAVMGNDRLRALPVQELVFENKPPDAELIATEKAKHDVAYQKRWGVDVTLARELPEGLDKRLLELGKRIYRVLGMTGYARVDFRLDEQNRPVFLEANPNPDIAPSEEFAAAAAVAGLRYEELIQRLLVFGLKRLPHMSARPAIQ
jgi:D-alanine-D-alanine ligase